MKKLAIAIAIAAAFAGSLLLTRKNPQSTDAVATSAASIPLSSSSPSASSSSGPPPPYKDGTFTGQTVDVGYGPVQVAAVVSGGKLTDVRFLQMPNDRAHSVEVSNYSAPQLKQEALQAQTANVDIVAGATQTSMGFQMSLRSALSQASKS